MKSSTPIIASVIACLLGTGAAAIHYEMIPPAPPELGLTEAAPPAAPTTKPALVLAAGDKRITKSGLTIVEVKDGTGVPSKPGDEVTVNYRGRLYYGGDEFANSYNTGDPWALKLGNGDAIAGFDEAATGMRVGAKREVVIPPNLAYGADGRGDKIPPNSTLVFDLEMMHITPGTGPTPTIIPPQGQ
ncbi:MAG: FKBP-type peptidyl-prolyl cis-trans isomerase [Tepidisphaeraceae bacterium]|jgi:peptidylprolyl isomerase